jgi:uncharacterized protein (DUF302 family)
MPITISRSIAADFDVVVARTIEALKAEGFGILTDINVQETMKAKLGIADFGRYRILGACNPPIAHAALTAQPDIGVMLPCNVVVRETGPGKVDVAAINPEMAIGAIGNPALGSLAKDVAGRLSRAVATL